MADLRVPALADNPFRDHYRALILGSALRSAEAEADRLRSKGHEARARRAERDAQRILGGAGNAATPFGDEHAFGRAGRVAVVVGFVATSSLLLGEVAATDVGSGIRMVTDLGVIAFTLLWFAVSVAGLGPPEADGAQAELPVELPKAVEKTARAGS